MQIPIFQIKWWIHYEMMDDIHESECPEPWCMITSSNSFINNLTSSSQLTNTLYLTEQTLTSRTKHKQETCAHIKGENNDASCCKQKGRTEENISLSMAWEFRETYSNLQITDYTFMHHIKYFALSLFMQTYTQYFTASVQQRTGFHTTFSKYLLSCNHLKKN